MIKALIIVGGCLGGILLSMLIASFIVLIKIFHRGNDDKNFDEIDLHGTHYEPYIDDINAAVKRMKGEPFEKVCITNREKMKLYANYYDRGASKTAVMVHGYHSNPFNNFSAIAGDMLDRGYNVLFVTQRSHGESEGKFIKVGRREQYDVLDWIEFAAAKENVKSILVYGTSMGGATVGYTADKIKNKKVKALTVDCGFTSFYEQIKVFLNTPMRKILYIGMPVFLLLISLILHINITKKNTECIQNTHLPICFIHGEADDCVPLSHTVENYEACPTPKKLIVVPKAGHTSSLLVGGAKTREEYFAFIDKFVK